MKIIKTNGCLDEANKDWDVLSTYLSSTQVDFNKYIEFFKANKQRLLPQERDLYYWTKRPPDEFIKRMVELQNTASNSREKQAEKNRGSEKVWENEDFLILKIINYGAAKYYGKGTKWCISGNNPTEGNDGNYFFNLYLKNEYSEIYFVLSKKTSEKWCVGMSKYNSSEIKHIWNAENDLIENIPNLPPVSEIGYEENRMDSFNADDEF